MNELCIVQLSLLLYGETTLGTIISANYAADNFACGRVRLAWGFGLNKPWLLLRKLTVDLKYAGDKVVKQRNTFYSAFLTMWLR